MVDSNSDLAHLKTNNQTQIKEASKNGTIEHDRMIKNKTAQIPLVKELWTNFV